jgi:hypothetical protein
MNAIYRSRTNLPRSVAFNLPLNTCRRTARRIKRLKETVLTISQDYSDRPTPDFLALSRSGRDGSFSANFYGKRVKMGVLTVNFRTRTAGGPNRKPPAAWCRDPFRLSALCLAAEGPGGARASGQA